MPADHSSVVPIRAIAVEDDLDLEEDSLRPNGLDVSIVVACLNSARSLRRCLDSVLCQTVGAAELIVIDGGSADGTVDILKSYGDRIVYWTSEPDRGIADAWNKGIAHAHGEWLYFLGADDFLWSPEVLGMLAKRLARVPSNQSVVFAAANVVAPGGRVIRTLGTSWDRREFLRVGMNVPHQGVLQRRILFDQLGRFDECFRIAIDYEFLLRYLKDREPHSMPDIVVAGQEAGGLSTSDRNTLKVLREFARARTKNGLPNSSPAFFARVGLALLKAAIYGILGEGAGRRVTDFCRRLAGREVLWTE